MTVTAAAEQTRIDEGQHKLPVGWRWVRLGELCDFLDYRRVPVNEPERATRIAGKDASQLFPYYGANGQVGWIDDYLFDEPLILLAEDGGYFGSKDKPIAYSVSGQYWVNNHAHVLRPRPVIDFDYCLYALRIRPDIGDLVSGSTRAKLNQEVAAGIPVPLPPLPEQRHIAAILTAQLAAVEQARAAAESQLAAAQDLPAAYLRAVFDSAEARTWPRWRLDAICELNPRRPEFKRPDEVLTTFVPMSAIDERDGVIARPELKPYSAVRRGYTYFGEGDVLFAKITPCMQNGKHAIARGLQDSIGFGSTEFHVLRPGPTVLPEWIHWYVRQPSVLLAATTHFEGAVGQQRVPAGFLAGLEIPIPPLREQKHIAAMLAAQMVTVERTRTAGEAQLAAINELPAALLLRALRGEL